MISSNFAGTSGFKRTGKVGTLWRIPSKTATVLLPWKACRPVAIS
jgi:hypothetical protein